MSGKSATLVADDDPLRLMYTSGTEARPKGAILTSRSLIAQYVSCIIEGEIAQVGFVLQQCAGVARGKHCDVP